MGDQEIFALIREEAFGSRFARNRALRTARLSPAWGLTRQRRSPKCLGHRVAASGHGIASACARLGGSETFIRSHRGDVGACYGRPRFRSLIKPHC
jgi:hypothetical protein